jgi:hypothetical protein
MADAMPVAANAAVDSPADASSAAWRSAVVHWGDAPADDRPRADWADPAERLRPADPDALDDLPHPGDLDDHLRRDDPDDHPRRDDPDVDPRPGAHRGGRLHRDGPDDHLHRADPDAGPHQDGLQDAGPRRDGPDACQPPDLPAATACSPAVLACWPPASSMASKDALPVCSAATAALPASSMGGSASHLPSAASAVMTMRDDWASAGSAARACLRSARLWRRSCARRRRALSRRRRRALSPPLHWTHRRAAAPARVRN